MKTYAMAILCLLFLACKQKQKPALPKKTEKPLITYYTYGELPPVGYIYYDTLFTMKNYQLKVKNMGGCEPQGVDYKELEKQNAKTALRMQNQFGKNWAKEFETQTKLKIIVPTPLLN